MRPGISACLFLGAAAFFALTWSGRYYHDGAALAGLFEGGVPWGYVAYMPSAGVLHALFKFLGVPEPEAALRALSVLAAAGTITLGAIVARWLFGSTKAALLAAMLVGLAAAPWFAATIVEKYSFAGLLLSVAMWLAVRAPGGLFVVPPLASILVLTGYFGCGVSIGGLVLLNAIAERRRGRCVTVWRVALSSLVTLAVAWGFAHFNAQQFGGEASSEVAGAFFDYLLAPLRSPSTIAGSFASRLVPAWGAVWALALLALAVAKRGQRLAALAVLAGLGPATLLVLVLPTLDGLYAVPATAFVVCGLAAWLQHALRRPGVHAVLALACTLQLAWSVRAHVRLAIDPEHEFAEFVAHSIEAPAVLVTIGTGRSRWLRRLTKLSIVDIGTIAGQAPAAAAEFFWTKARELQDAGTPVYFDRRALYLEPPLDAISAAVRKRFATGELPRWMSLWRMR